MYKIIFKGRDLEPLFADDDKGKIIMETFVADKKTKVVLNGIAFFTGDIKQIIKLDKNESEKAPKNNTYERDYLDFRKKMLDLPLERRASILRIPKLIWSTNTKREMPEDVKEEIKNRQLAYFQSFPNCIYANPKIYKDLMPKHPPEREIENVKPIQNIIPKLTLRMVEEMIRTDLQYSIK